jgi:hypothetical protein
MMETLQAILTRRSVREFTNQDVSKEDLNDLLRAGMQAPSAGNEQPWHFIVIDDPELLKKIPEFHPYAKMLNEAPLAILVCSDRNLEKHRATWLQDCSAAIENILLTAHAKGLGAFGWVFSRMVTGLRGCNPCCQCPGRSALLGLSLLGILRNNQNRKTDLILQEFIRIGGDCFQKWHHRQ